MPYHNLILDLGGVILDIDYHRTIRAFEDLGIKDTKVLYSQQSQTKLFDLLEKGFISDKEFYDSIREKSNTSISDENIMNAWNAILIGLPADNLKVLHELKKKYRLFLLSNTNSIHETAYRKMIKDEFGSFVFDNIFEKMYLSHHIHLRKPEKEIFEYVLNDSKLNPKETFFIDDSKQHLAGANAAGIDSWLMPKGYSLRKAVEEVL